VEVKTFDVPFRHWLLNGAVSTGLLEQLAAGVPAADWPHWVCYSSAWEKKRTTRALDMLPVCFQLVFVWLMSNPWLARLEQLTGVQDLLADPDLHGAGLHVMDRGDYLTTHLDYNLHPQLLLERRLNLVLFLNQVWSEEWGGAFDLYDDMGEGPVKRIYPSFGQMVLWESSELAYHGTQLVSLEAKHPRLTLACYYLSPPRPGVVRKRALFIPQRAKP
jgi:Rps23 Pro-64 3,4-dihydroxylase Tpa1-like proline 4-hydroxylase